MSYILDALQKSEAEQDPVAAANLALNQQRNRPRRQLMQILVVIALLINVSVLVWLFGPTERAGPTVVAVDAGREPAAQTPGPAAPLPPAPPVPVAAATFEPAVGQPVNVQPDPLEAVPRAQPAAHINARLTELPAAVRGRFPGLAFSTHIYADDPSLRAVVANGRRLVEGDEIDGAAVERITETGVVLGFENYLVEIPVVAEWQ